MSQALLVDQKQDDTEPVPACGVAIQCADKTFRSVTHDQIAGFFEPCRNDDCFPDDDPAPDETVVVARGRGTGSLHAPEHS